MKYMKESLLFKIGVLNVLWITVSYLEVIFHNPFTPYYWWNYFDLIARGATSERHAHETLCTLLHVALMIIIIVSVLYFLMVKKNGMIDLYVISMAVIIIITCASLITTHEDVCMYVGMFIEILYLYGLASELSIER